MENKKLRNPSFDVIRIFALFLVVSVHFFLHIGYYYTPIAGEKLFVMTVIRSFAKACVLCSSCLRDTLCGTKS